MRIVTINITVDGWLKLEVIVFADEVSHGL